MISCFLSLGSNIGDKLSNLDKGISCIEASNKNTLVSRSPIYESKAMYNKNLENFYNCVIKIETELTAAELLLFLKNIEKKQGRKLDEPRYSARHIDIDILSYGQDVIDTPQLKIPHPAINERKFVLKPWADIDSNYIIASSSKKIFDLLNETSDNSELIHIKK